ncbi:paraquat-inducible protein B [Enterobacter sp. CGMCC 5087]|nr:paraquat-inducible protein B [Enterobacter sp. CGMCC 5087]
MALLLGGGSLFMHLRQQGTLVTVIADRADGIKAGKTRVKSHSVDVGVVESTRLSDDLEHVVMQLRLKPGVSRLLSGESVFRRVEARAGPEGVTGLETLLRGDWIALEPGGKGPRPAAYRLADGEATASSRAKGVRIGLTTPDAGLVQAGEPVLFQGYRVGQVEHCALDAKARQLFCRAFIRAPYDHLVTTRVRFHKEHGVAMAAGASGIHLKVASVTTLLSGGVSFDLPQGMPSGVPVKNGAMYALYGDREAEEESRFTQHTDYVMYFEDTVRGLLPGAPVEFRGVRVGTVSRVPFPGAGEAQLLHEDYRIPVAVRIEPGRLVGMAEGDADAREQMDALIRRGMHGTLKIADLVTGALYIELDCCGKGATSGVQVTSSGYPVIPSLKGGLIQVQQGLLSALDRFSALPARELLTQATRTLTQGHQTLRDVQMTLDALNRTLSSPAVQRLPADTQQTLRTLQGTLQSVQPGTVAYTRMVADLQRLNQALLQLQPVLSTLNSRSNALVVEEKPEADPVPVAR